MSGLPTSGLPLGNLVANDWSEVGVKTTVREITPDEYRSAQSANLLDVGAWGRGQPLLVVLSSNQAWVPPFSTYFVHRQGMLRAEWVQSDGTGGMVPPDYAKQLIDDINAIQSAPIDSEEFEAFGQRMVKNMTENLLFIAAVQGPLPIHHRNSPKNFAEFQTHNHSYLPDLPVSRDAVVF